MAVKSTKQKKNGLPKIQDVKMNKIGVFFKRSILNQIMKILTMEHGGFRTYKSIKNINRLFTNIDMSKYKNNQELQSYIWCICYFSKQWLDGVVHPEIIEELAKRQPDYDNIKGEIISKSINDKNIITAPEAKALFDLIAEALQFGFIVSMKDQYISLLDDISLDTPGAFKELATRLFMISQSLLDIRYNTNLVANKVTFSTADLDSLKEAVSSTIESLSSSSNMLKTGIKRWNTLLSPAYMNGRLYVYAGAAGSGKSIALEKTAFDIRKYNPNYIPKTPGMKPCVLYITMENTFMECIERLWNMSYDDSITDYTVDEAVEKLCKELGISKVLKEDVKVYDITDDDNNVENNNLYGLSTNVKKPLITDIISGEDEENLNIEVVMKYFSYREISTDDLFTIIYDLREENMEVCALVFDYIKRIEPSIPTPDNVKLELNHISNELKALAVRCDIPVITAHQLNRSAAEIMDNASKQGKSDVIKLTSRANIGDAWEIFEVADWIAFVNIEFKPGTNQRFIELHVLKRRRIDSADNELAQYTYLAHPFAKNNGMRLIDDIYLDKILSLKSLSSDIDIIGKEKTNAVPRLKIMQTSEFDEDDDF